MRRLPIFPLAAAVAFSVTASAAAETPADFQRLFETAARQEVAGFAGFSAQRGATFFKTTHGREWSCASCHTRNPTATGRHAKTDKPITRSRQPRTPSAYPARQGREMVPAQLQRRARPGLYGVRKRAMCSPISCPLENRRR